VKFKKAIFFNAFSLYKCRGYRKEREDIMKKFIFSQAVADRYKQMSESINADNKRVKKTMTMKSIITESFFHGASWMGQNFIA